MVLACAVWRLAHRRQSASLLPAKIPTVDVATLPAGSWQRRGLVAEKRAQEAHAAIYAGLLPHLAHLMKITRAGDMVITMGAGDIWKFGEAFIALLKGGTSH